MTLYLPYNPGKHLPSSSPVPCLNQYPNTTQMNINTPHVGVPLLDVDDPTTF